MWFYYNITTIRELYRRLLNLENEYNDSVFLWRARQVKIDKSRTCVYWNDRIDLPSDTLYEYGVSIE